MSISDFIVGFLWVALALQLLDLAKIFFIRKKKRDPWRSNDFAEVKPWLATLLRRGYAGGHALFATDKADRFLMFRKYIREKSDYGLELCFPGTDGAAAYWPQLQAYCEETGFRHRMEAEESNGAPRDVLLIDCKQDVDRAYDLALTIWTKLFRLSPDNWYDRKIHDISFQDELIDSPDHPNLWPEAADGINYDVVKQLLRDTVALSPADVFFLSGLTLLAHISLIGLPAATLLSVSEPHDWTLVLGGIALGGSTASLVFFLIYVFAFLMLRGFLDDKKKFKKAMANKQTSRAGLYYPMRRFVTIMLPIAVILIWAGA